MNNTHRSSSSSSSPAQPVAFPPRQQVSIERLPARHATTEPRESMNCKSCRKRKIKCNRLRPSCEACKVFQCPCIYDAVPKKRGPKTDVLEALLKRVDGLEAKLKERNDDSDEPSSSSSPSSSSKPKSTAQDLTIAESSKSSSSKQAELEAREPTAKRVAIAATTKDDKAPPLATRDPPVHCSKTPTVPQSPTPHVQTDALLHTYFTRFHAKPYHILDESCVRKRIQQKRYPSYLLDAIAAVAARHTPHPKGYQAAAKLSEEYAARARGAIDVDEPSIDALQALLLLATAYTAAGKGKKTYMLMTNAVGMIMALELHREMDARAHVTPAERETRRRIFWSCYLLDRYAASGSKRPSLISEDSIVLRLPSWSSNLSTRPVEGEFFLCGPNLQYLQGSGKRCQSSFGMLIDITRILGITNQYLAAGGVKGDSHFPWHSLSNLSKIRQELDVWASVTVNIFCSFDALFGQADSTVLVLCKLIYHLIHCLIYRPFLPISLAELSGNAQHQSWQIEAINMCFLHANAIAELIEVGRQGNAIEWPSFVGYCICTAGTVHIHGAHYSRQGDNDEMCVFSSSAELLSREMQLLSELRYTWAVIQHQRDMLGRLYDAHGDVVKTVTGNTTRYAPGFQLEDFFDRYSSIGGPEDLYFSFDAANLSLPDVMLDLSAEPPPTAGLQVPIRGEGRPNLKRKNTPQSSLVDMPEAKSRSGPPQPQPTPALSTTTTTTYPHRSLPVPAGVMPPHMTTGAGPTSTLLPTHRDDQQQQMNAMRGAVDVTATGNAVADFGLSHASQSAELSFNPAYSYHLGPTATAAGQPAMNDGSSGGFDTIFGTIPTNAYYGSCAGWQGDTHRHTVGQPTTSGAAAPSPGTKSNTGSVDTAVEEKDPFMSLLEQLANDEQRQNNGLVGALDFFLTNTGGPS